MSRILERNGTAASKKSIFDYNNLTAIAHDPQYLVDHGLRIRKIRG
jgi:hypothetical protein